jgi:teichuronic acid biosynthesis glycosyltransferase TuaG
MNSTVSIIIPAYNAARFIAATLQSVIDQKYTSWEVLVVLDAKSTDSTEKIASDFSQRDSRIRLIKTPLAQGVTANRNIGLDHASGEYIAFLDADDQWLPEKLSKQLALMQKSHCLFSYTGQENIAMDSGQTLSIISGTATTSYADLLANNRMACSSVIVRRDFLGTLRFEENLAEDMVLWLKLLKKIPYACGVAEPLLKYRVVVGSRSANKIELAKNRWFIYRKVENLSLLSSLWYFVQYAITGYLKNRKR